MLIETFVLFGHLLVAGLIIALVLLQRGKGADAGSGFGAGASGTVFGARGSSSFFSRATAVLATLFFATSLTLAYFATQVAGDGLLEGSLLENAEIAEPGIGVQASPEEVPELGIPDGDLPAGVGEPPELEQPPE